MGDQFKNIMIGVFVIAALAIIVFIMLFLHPNIGNEGKTLRVRFSDIDKISVGTRVTFAGKPVGEVLKIDEIDAGERIEQNGVIYVYELLLAVDTSVDIFETDQIASRTSGLLGEKSVAITPQPIEKGRKKIEVESQIIYANETGSVESTLKEFKNLSDKIAITLDSFIGALDTLKKERFWENVSDAAKNAAEISATFNNPEKLTDIMDNLSEGSRKFADAFKNFDEGSLHFKTIMTNVQNGEGSMGKILVNDDFYLRLSSLLSKAEVTLNDVNHYGVLFHLDKGWQRLRARRLNLMQKLSTPEEFRNYFNDEIDTITTSLERVSSVMEEVDSQPCQALWQNPGYVKVYAELLRRVAMLEEYLKMYNQQVVECPVEETEFINCY